MVRFPFFLAVVVGCTGTDKPETGDTDTGDGPGWTLVAKDHPSAFLSIWGSGPDDVWAVGADAGSGPAVVHFDGAAWTSVDTGSTGDLWWVASTSADTLWMGGEAGRVLRHSRATGTTEETVLDPAITVFGIWGAADDDVWAVGGDVNESSDASQVWHHDGTAWSQVVLPPGAAAAFAVYKVWGRSASDVYAVGSGGAGLHWDGTAWSDITTGTTRTLFTVHGTATEEYAVGGQFTGTLVSGHGSWTDVTPSAAAQLNGVYAGGPAPVAVGTTGKVYVKGDAGWALSDRGDVTPYDLHAVWVDDEGGIWTVGGKLSSFPLDHGILAYGGDRAVPAL